MTIFQQLRRQFCRQPPYCHGLPHQHHEVTKISRRGYRACADSNIITSIEIFIVRSSTHTVLCVKSLSLDQVFDHNLLRRLRVFVDNLVLSTELIMWIGHRNEIRKMTFRALALRRSESDK